MDKQKTITITLDEYAALERVCERVAAVERMLNGDDYITINEIAAVLNINIPRKELIENEAV
jgi:hypothetical protein